MRDLERPPDKVLAFVASMPLLYGDDVAPATSYACPMHPEVTSSEPGTCPKCGMQLLPVRSEKPSRDLLRLSDAPGGHVLGAGNVPEVRHEAGALRRAAGDRTKMPVHHGHEQHEDRTTDSNGKT